MKDRRLWLLLAAALAIRLALMPLPDPYDADLTTFWLPWMAYGAEHGLGQLYLHGQPAVNYPPLFLTLLLALGRLYRLISPTMAYGPLQSVLIKLPAVVADLAIAVLLYRSAAQLVRDERGTPGSPTAPGTIPLLAAALWVLNPATWYVSAFWAQVDSIHTLWMLAALSAALTARWGWSGLFLALALLTKLQAAVIVPLIVFLAACFSWRAVAWTVLGLGGTLALGLAPFALNNTLDAVGAVYFGAVGFYPALTVNAYNGWFMVQFAGVQLLGRYLLDTTRVLGPVTLRTVGLAAMAAYTALLLWMLWRGGLARSTRGASRQALSRRAWLTPERRAVVFFAAGMLVFGFFSLATEMHERYALPALAFLAVPAARSGRLLVAYVLLSGSIFVNLLRVLPWGPGVFGLIQGIPGDRVLISLVSLALFVWLTVLFLVAAGRLAREKDEPHGMATVSDGLQ